MCGGGTISREAQRGSEGWLNLSYPIRQIFFVPEEKGAVNARLWVEEQDAAEMVWVATTWSSTFTSTRSGLVQLFGGAPIAAMSVMVYERVTVLSRLRGGVMAKFVMMGPRLSRMTLAAAVAKVEPSSA